jgi:hypothetical protein
MTVHDLIQEARTLSVEERKQLMKALIDMIEPIQNTPQTPHRLRDFRGVGAHLYDGTDAQDSVNQMRREWDERP